MAKPQPGEPKADNKDAPKNGQQGETKPNDKPGQNDKKAERRANKYWWWVVGTVPGALFALWFYLDVAKPIICGVTAGCGSASW